MSVVAMSAQRGPPPHRIFHATTFIQPSCQFPSCCRFCGAETRSAWKKLRCGRRSSTDSRANSRIRPRHAIRSQGRWAHDWTYIHFYIIMAAKRLFWMGSSKAALEAFPDLARREAGNNLWFVQTGKAPRSWRPMPDVGEGVIELRVHCGTDHRVFYVAKFDEAIYVLHAYEKRSQTTNKNDLAIGRRRYREVIARRATKTH